jgi:ABC-type multidrug transport system ATPase subunit/pSer/pThr/pTyr-binding forkhead associated (FHA) protein
MGTVRFLSGPLAGAAYPLNKPIINIGRESSNDIVISDPSVSRQHVQLVWENNTWTIQKLATYNNLLRNQQEINQSKLSDNDTIAMGRDTTFIFLNQVPPANATPLQRPHPSQAGSPLPTDPPPGGWRGSSSRPPLPSGSPSSPGNPNISARPARASSQPTALHIPISQQPMPPVPVAVQGSNPTQRYTPPPAPQAPMQPQAPPSAPVQRSTPALASAPPQAPMQPQAPPSAPPQRSTPTPPIQRPASAPALIQDHDNGFTPIQRIPTQEISDENNGSSQTEVPSIVVSTNTDSDKQSYSLPPDQPIFDIGRDASNTIVVNRPTVSGFHFRIVRDGNNLILIHPHPDRKQTVNGLIYQGRKIAGTERFRHILQRGDVFRISDQEGTFVSLTYNDGSGQAQEALPEVRPIPLGASTITIGRAPSNNVRLDHPQVSSYHARMERTPIGYRLVDLHSTNHVFVNNQRISAHDLRPGDIIRIGSFRLTYTGNELTQQDESQGIRIDALHLVRRGDNNAVLLNDISFAIPPRKFVALVGGSGAGKSTLMNALNGSRPAQEGGVLYNGQDYYTHAEAYSAQLGYVPQDDIIHRDLTVERALYYAARLRLPKDFTEEQIQERINEVLVDVEMMHRRNLLISQLSGGQRKRVSIALELLAKPAIFFLDEPTSGLDPGLDRKMMLLLRKLADKGHTIVLVTHATNNINACDYVCFLCQGGRLAYFGPPDGAKEYFGRADFAEIYSTLEPTEERPDAPGEAEFRFKQSRDYLRYVVEPLQQGPAGQRRFSSSNTPVPKPTPGNPWKQFLLLSQRYIELILNDRVNLAILLLQAPIIGIILFMMMQGDTFSSTSIAPCVAPTEIGSKNSENKIYNCQDIVNLLKTREGEVLVQSQNMTLDETLQGSVAKSVSELGVFPGWGAQKILLIMSFAAIMFGCLNGSREIVKEGAIYQRERAVNLGLLPYLLSKIAVLGSFSLVQSFILVLIVHIRSPLGDTHSIFLPSFLEVYITMALTSLAGLMTGLLISAIVPNNDRAMSLVPLPLIPQIIFAGVVFNLDQFPLISNNSPILQIIGAIFPARWSMAALGSTIGLRGDLLQADNFSYLGLHYTHVWITDAIQSAATGHLLTCWVMLLLLIFAQAGGIVWFLKKKDLRV